MENEQRAYYLGLDIGTDSVGYAAAGENYDLMKFHGEPVWGVTTFEEAELAEARRMNRTARRRLDRRQQRVQLVSDIFAGPICRIDRYFFIRRQESALFHEDTQHGVKLFDGGITDKEYHNRFPTIHHLICALMDGSAPQDVRLVYLACAWLTANRGHFLLEASAENISDFSGPFREFREYLNQELECGMPWPEDVSADTIQEIMQADTGVTRKKEMFTSQVYGGKKPAKNTDGYPFRRDVLVSLLCGGKEAPKNLFPDGSYDDVESVSLGMDEDGFAEVLGKLGDDGMLLRLMRSMYDCALLNITKKGETYISVAKKKVYEQHKADLKWLKYFIRKYAPKDYAKVFRRAEKGNYTAYSYNLKNCPNPNGLKKAKKEEFSEWLKKVVKDIRVEPEDTAAYQDMLDRLDRCAFLPKQKDSDNRVIPQQLYYQELALILVQARKWLPMLTEADADGITNEQKLLAIFRFRIPYFVGPLNRKSDSAWLKREDGKIYPWNFEKMVDLDESERRFISRMTNTCTYLPGEPVLPYCSLLYSRYMVLNELNNLKVNGRSIPVEVKQELFTELYQKGGKKRVTLKAIAAWLRSHGRIGKDDEVTGMDENANASLESYHKFRRLLESGALTEEQAEDIIRHAAFSEERSRMARWLNTNYPALSDADRQYILKQNLKEFGRLSEKLLTGIYGCEAGGTGEAFTIMEALWQTNVNLMQLLSEKYTFRSQIQAFAEEYYTDPQHRKTLSERLSDMYISNTVKRQIIRSLDVTGDVVKAMGCPPKKIFIEMARGGTQDQRGRRTVSRKQQILDWYKQVRHEDVPALRKALEDMGAAADNRLQSDKLFLYYMQLGRCMYTGQPIDLEQLGNSKLYDIDHIYPQSKVQDDSILNNKVLVTSKANGDKSDRYPIDASVRISMHSFWDMLHIHGMITDEKFRRLTRATGFTDDELHQFINRQLVETRQSTKAVAQLLKERWPDTEIVYVKAGLVSEFRQQFDLLKCRSVNDLHHAKDAYLNIVVGNVYHEKFTRRWFDTTQPYNIAVGKVFANEQKPYGRLVWRGQEDVARIKKIAMKNAVHVTRYAFCRKGGLFDQMPLAAAEGLIPRKAGLPTEKYGGYNKPTASFYYLASFTMGKKKEVMFVPVELRFASQVLADSEYAVSYVAGVISEICSGKEARDVKLLLNGRPVKINSVITLDGLPVILRGKCNKGANMIVSTLTQLVLGYSMEKYVKNLERYIEKKKANPSIQLNSEYDHISKEENLALYECLTQKMSDSIFQKSPGNVAQTLIAGSGSFSELAVDDQIKLLLGIIGWFGAAPGCDLSSIGGKSKSGAKVPSSKLSALAKTYHDIRIVDNSPAGLFSSRSENLLELL